MSKLLILGAGGHGKVVAETAMATGRWKSIAFLDDELPVGTRVLDFPVVGAFSDALALHETYGEALVAVGDSHIRLDLMAQLSTAGFLLPVLVHSSAVVSPSAFLAEGTVVFAQAVVQADTQIGRGCIINTASTVDHDCRLDDGVHVCPGSHLAGGVSVGQSCWLGIGSVIIQNIQIGDESMVAAGAVVISDVERHSTVAGLPAKLIQKGN